MKYQIMLKQYQQKDKQNISYKNFISKYLSSGIFQNYLVFIPAKKYIKYFSGTTRRIDSLKSNGMSRKC